MASGSAFGVGMSSTKYDGVMSVQQYLVSTSGQVSLPASVRHRWKLDNGGPVDVIDLGFGVLTVPQGTGKRLLSDLLPREAHAEFVDSLSNDLDLATT
jgi:bifunctional DNA-binding transcriptional regulator/antitoxin component of YhaV-PrlF toxin-antitoxin module